MSNGDVRKGPATIPKSPVLPVADPTPVEREMLDDPVLEGAKVKDVLVQFSSPQYFVLEGEGAVEVGGRAVVATSVGPWYALACHASKRTCNYIT